MYEIIKFIVVGSF